MLPTPSDFTLTPTPEYRYLLYDPEGGTCFYRTPEDRLAAFQAAREWYRGVDGTWEALPVLQYFYAAEVTHVVNELALVPIPVSPSPAGQEDAPDALPGPT